MSPHRAATGISLSHDQHREADTRLHGRRLLLARGIWISLVVLTLGVYVSSLPVYFTELRTVCRLAVCPYGQLSPDTAAYLEHLGLSVSSYAICVFALAALIALAFFGTAGVIVWRKSDDWVALLMALGLVLGGTIPILFTLGTDPSTRHLPILLMGELSFLVFFLDFTIFPDGRLVPRWTSWLLVAFGVESVVIVFFTNSIPFSSSASLWIVVSLDVLFFALYVGLIVAQIYRYRYVSTFVQRQQTKWVVFGLSVDIVLTIVTIFPALIFPRSLAPLIFVLVYFCSLFIYPVTIGVAILRHRLLDIDVLINRTLVYGSLTASLAFVYFGLIFALQYLLRGLINQNNDVAIVASTLTIYVLFQPLRGRLQNIVDRRFYRRKYDAARILEAFSATLRHEVDVSRLSENLIAVVQETMQPAHISLWLCSTASNRQEQASRSSPSPAP
jgi:hypothetical protein